MFKKDMSDEDMTYGFNCLKSYLDYNITIDTCNPTPNNINLSKNPYVIPYEKTTIKQIAFQYHYLLHCKRMFPTAFRVLYIKTKLRSNILNKIKVKAFNLPVKNTNDGYLQIESFSVLPLIFHFQYMSYIKGEQVLEGEGNITLCNFEEFYEAYSRGNNKQPIQDIETTSVSKYIIQELGSDFSDGELIDFVDRLYDLYKQTNISVQNFRTIFYCFGKYIDVIGSEAFDLYMTNRDTLLSWQTAVINFISSYYLFSPGVSKLLTKKLFTSK